MIPFIAFACRIHFSKKQLVICKLPCQKHVDFLSIAPAEQLVPVEVLEARVLPDLRSPRVFLETVDYSATVDEA